MTSAIAPHVVFEIPGVPPSPNRTRYTREDPDVLAYRDLTIFHARGAKNRAHWRNDGEPAPRWLFIVLQRHALLDPDHAWASITPVLNGMKGSLLYLSLIHI